MVPSIVIVSFFRDCHFLLIESGEASEHGAASIVFNKCHLRACLVPTFHMSLISKDVTYPCTMPKSNLLTCFSIRTACVEETVFS